MIYKNLQQEPFISYGHMNMKNDFRLLMTELAYLSRSYIVSVIAGFGNTTAIASRLYSLPIKFKQKAELIFGIPLGEELVNVLSMHVIYLQSFVNALKNGDQANVDESVKQLYKNSDNIAAYYAKINPFWDQTQWKNLLYTYDAMLIEEAVALMSGEYEKDLDIFERSLLDALSMGDYLADGIMQYLLVTCRDTATQSFKR